MKYVLFFSTYFFKGFLKNMDPNVPFCDDIGRCLYLLQYALSGKAFLAHFVIASSFVIVKPILNKLSNSYKYSKKTLNSRTVTASMYFASNICLE